MDVTPLVRKGQQIIQSYSGGVFKVSGVSYSGPVLVFPDGTQAWEIGDGACTATVSDLNQADFSVLLDQSDALDVVLFGSGRVIEFLSPELRASLKAGGLQVEVMDSGAACRTYNVLMAEGRRVACAVLPT